MSCPGQQRHLSLPHDSLIGVAQSPNIKMDIANLAKVFVPTIVDHAVPNPDPMTMLQDIKHHSKMVECLLSLPLEYWSQFMMVE